MTDCKVELKYDGPALAAHTMDVSLLAPALMSFGDLLRETNRVINGDKAQVKVFVNANIKANCVTISFYLVQSLSEAWSATKSFLSDENVASVKTLFEWLMIGGGGFSLFHYLSHEVKQTPENVATTNTKSKIQESKMTITINGDGNTVNVSPEVISLAKDARVIKAAQGVVAPLIKSGGIDNVTFIEGISKKIITKDEAEVIYAISLDEMIDNEDTQYITGHIMTHSPVFNIKAKHWSFEYNGHVENIDISSTSIAKDTLARGKVLVGDTYKVQLEIKEKKTASGYKYTYKVINVLDFTPGNEQMQMIFERKVLSKVKRVPKIKTKAPEKMLRIKSNNNSIDKKNHKPSKLNKSKNP